MTPFRPLRATDMTPTQGQVYDPPRAIIDPPLSLPQKSAIMFPKGGKDYGQEENSGERFCGYL